MYKAGEFLFTFNFPLAYLTTWSMKERRDAVARLHVQISSRCVSI